MVKHQSFSKCDSRPACECCMYGGPTALLEAGARLFGAKVSREGG